jgi:hypothetical protein
MWLDNDYRTSVDDALGHGVHDVNRALPSRQYLGDHPEAAAATYGIDATVRLARIAREP